MAFTKVTRPTDDLNTGFGKFNDLIDDLISTTSGAGASQIGIQDVAGNVSATNVEDAIAEIYTDTANSVIQSALFDEDSGTTTGLTWGFKEGTIRVDATITTVSASTVGLTDDDVNYVEVDPSDSTMKSNTTSFTTGRIPIRQVTTVGGEQTVSTDKRAWFSREGTATTTSLGVVEYSTDAESVTGTSDDVVVTPGTLTARLKEPGPIGGTTQDTASFTTLTVNTAFAGGAFLDEDDMASDSDTKVSSQQAIKAFVETRLPSGIITMWSGAISAIPTGWLLCDGTNGTPDLTDRFVIHADSDSGGTNDVGDTGGSNTIVEANLPAHTHAAGTLATANDGNHNHSILLNSSGSSDAVQYSDTGVTLTNLTSTDGAHTHSISGSTGSTGSGSAYKPKYYALAYIQKE
jgi:hypothetical protein